MVVASDRPPAVPHTEPPGEATQQLGQLLRNFAVLGAGNYGAMVVSLVINALLTRRLGVEQFGRLALLLMASQVAVLLAANWTQTGLVRFGAQEFASVGSVAETFWARIWVVAPWATVAALGMIAAGDRLAGYLGIPTWGLAVVLAHFLASFLLSTVGAVFQARNEMSRYGAALFLDKAVMAAFVLLLPTGWVREPLSVLAMFAASSISVATWGVIALGRRSLMPVTFSRTAYRNMLAFSLPLIFSSWAGLLGTNWFDYIVIKAYRPASDIGLYSLGTLLAGVVQQVTIVFSTLLLPQLSVMVAKGELDRIRTLAQRILPYWFLGTSVVFVLVLFSAGWIVPLVFGRAFERSVPVLAVLMLAACALALFNALSPLVSALGSSWALSGICLASGLVNVVMDLLLIPRHGILGAALATVIAYATSAVLVLAFVQARLKSRVFDLGLCAVPVAAVCLCFLLLDGFAFFLWAVPAGVLTVYWLVRRFRLFRGEDAVVLRDLRVAVSLPPGAGSLLL